MKLSERPSAWNGGGDIAKGYSKFYFRTSLNRSVPLSNVERLVMACVADSASWLSTASWSLAMAIFSRHARATTMDSIPRIANPNVRIQIVEYSARAQVCLASLPKKGAFETAWKAFWLDFQLFGERYLEEKQVKNRRHEQGRVFVTVEAHRRLLLPTSLRHPTHILPRQSILIPVVQPRSPRDWQIRLLESDTG